MSDIKVSLHIGEEKRFMFRVFLEERRRDGPEAQKRSVFGSGFIDF